MTSLTEIASRYQAFFGNLTDENVVSYRNLASPNVRYRDPFADARGIDSVLAYMHSWFTSLDELQFILQDDSVDVDGRVGFGDWIMRFRIRKSPGKLWEIEGVSKVFYNEDGKAFEHIDYWDPTPLFESVPLLGKVVSLMKRSAF